MKRDAYRERDYAFGQLMLTLRMQIGLTQAGLAQLLHLNRRSVAGWEAGGSYPKAEHLKAFIALAVKEQAFPGGREEEEIRSLWKAAHQKVLLTVVSIWEVASARRSKVLDGHRLTVYGLAWSPDGSLLASSGWDSAIRLWDPTTVTCVQILRDLDHPDTVFYGVAWSPDGQRLACGSYLYGVQVWNVTATARSTLGEPSAPDLDPSRGLEPRWDTAGRRG